MGEGGDVAKTRKRTMRDSVDILGVGDLEEQRVLEVVLRDEAESTRREDH